MADTIERLYKVTVDGTAAVRQLEKIAASTGAVDSKLKAFGDSLKVAAAQLGAAFAAKEFVAGILRTSEALDQLGKDAQSVGIAVEELQRLRYAADLSGVSAETMDKAVTSLAVGMADLASGTSDTAKALRAVGVTGGDSPTAALAKIADQFAAMPDGIEKTAQAVALFGKKIGPDLIPLLNGGADALAKLSVEADKFGGVVSAGVIAQAEAFNDNLARLEKAAAGGGKQLTVGLLPALSGVAEALVGVVSKSDAFQSFGEGLGTILVAGAKAAALLGETITVLGTDIAAIAAIVSHPTEAGTIWRAWMKDLDDVDAKTKKFFDDLDKGAADARAKMGQPAPVPTPVPTGAKGGVGPSDESIETERKKRAKEADEAATQATRDRMKAEQEHADMMKRVYAVAAAEVVAIKERDLEVSLQLDEQATRNAKALDRVGTGYADLTKEAQAWNDEQDRSVQRQQQLLDMLDNGTAAQQRYAQGQLDLINGTKDTAVAMQEQSEVLDIVGGGFDRFVDALSSGSVSAAEAFKGMAESIIADLLKLLAKKYILDAFFPGAGAGAAAAGAHGLAFEAGAVLPFARGGIVSQPLMLPMALMGEAGPEAVMPLRRGADGNLGVMAQGGAAPINISIRNLAGADISARRTGPQDIEIMVNRAREAIAADVRSGGTPVSRALEQAYSLGRGAAARF